MKCPSEGELPLKTSAMTSFGENNVQADSGIENPARGGLAGIFGEQTSIFE